MSRCNVLRYVFLNRGHRFIRTQRKQHSIVGPVLVGPARLLKEKAARLMEKLEPLPNPVRCRMLISLLDQDEQLFFAVARNSLPRLLPMTHTPGAGDSCLDCSELEISMTGVWIEINESRILRKVLANWGDSAEDIVVSDCKRKLCLGDLEAEGTETPISLLLVYTAYAWTDPEKCLLVVPGVGFHTKASFILRKSSGWIWDEMHACVPYQTFQ